MGSITDLVDLREADLFPDEAVDWGCEGNKEKLMQDENTGKYFYNTMVEGEGERRTYCDYGNRSELQNKIAQRRASLKTAIEVYMEEVINKHLLSTTPRTMFSEKRHLITVRLASSTNSFL